MSFPAAEVESFHNLDLSVHVSGWYILLGLRLMFLRAKKTCWWPMSFWGSTKAQRWTPKNRSGWWMLMVQILSLQDCFTNRNWLIDKLDSGKFFWFRGFSPWITGETNPINWCRDLPGPLFINPSWRNHEIRIGLLKILWEKQHSNGNFSFSKYENPKDHPVGYIILHLSSMKYPHSIPNMFLSISHEISNLYHPTY